jgi:hypothetical protein
MMHIRRVLTLAVVVAALVSAPTFGAQQNIDQEDLSEQEQRDTQALVQMVEAAAAGTQPAPADFGLQWESNHFMGTADGATYIPFTLAFDAGQLAAPGTALYVRVLSKNAPPASDAAAEPPPPVDYSWDDINFVDVPPDGKLSRAMVLQPGEYEVFVAVKEKSPLEAQENPPPAKAALLRRDITVPDFAGPTLSISSVLIGAIEPLAAPLSPEQQKDNPYTFGQLRVVMSTDSTLKKSGELQALFWIYGTQQSGGKPDVQLEYSFHRQTAEGETYFNKTPAQVLNASTLPPQFDVATDVLPGILAMPLASFPVGEYRLEITLTDSISGETLIHNTSFTVEA